MSAAAMDRGSEGRPPLQLPDFDERKLKDLLIRWREKCGLEASDEKQFTLFLKALVMSREPEVLESDAFIQLVEPFAGEVRLSDEEKGTLVRQVKPLLRIREITVQEKEELARSFDQYRMRLWSKVRRSIGAALEAQFDPDDVLSEAYIRAESRWCTRPIDPAKTYVWLYGIVHDQYRDMLRRAKAAKRGGHVRSVRLPDNSAAEIALELWQSQTGASVAASRREFESKFRELLETHLSRNDLEIFSMRVLDRLEYPEIVAELVRRAEQTAESADYETILTELDSRSKEDDTVEEDVQKRRADAIRQRFKRALKKLTGAILAEFPDLLDALPEFRLAKP
jgi:DNA-directed RNA polymerase specialized sigma24 family protein